MSATVIINRWTGSAAGAATAITSGNTRSSTSDNAYTTETTNPIPVPAAGTNYSFWVSTRLHTSTSPAGTINNINWYTDGTDSEGTGVSVSGQAANVGANAGYRQATGTAGTTGDLLNTTNHTGLTGATVDVFGLTSGSPKSLTGSTSTTGDFGDFWVYQYAVITTALPSSMTQETFSWTYDET